MKKLYLVDVSAMFYRAYYAIRPLSTTSGQPTNALFGFLNMTVKLLKEVKPDYIAFCYDSPTPSFRKELDPRYKANRSETPSDLVQQIPFIYKLTDALGIPHYSVAGYEADDLIGTLTTFGRNHDLEVTIVSGDKDFSQLVGPFVTMYDTMKEERLDESAVVEKWGVKPSQFIDYLALIGDSSDNIPGVAGIGPKGAQKLLTEYPSLETIYQNIGTIRNKSVVDKLVHGKEEAQLSKQLVTIRKDVPLDCRLEDLKLKPIDQNQLRSLLKELEFKSFEKKFFSEPSNSSSKEQAQTPSSNLPGPTQNFSEIALRVAEVAKKVPEGQTVWGLLTERGIYLSFDGTIFVLQGDPIELGEVLSDKDLRWKGYDLKTLWSYLQISDPIPQWDQMLAAYVVRAGTIESFEDIFEKYTGKQLPALPVPSDLINSQIELEQVLKEQLEKSESWDVYTNIELPLVPVLYSMESHGVLLDLQTLSQQNQELVHEIREAEQTIYRLAGQTFNIGSPKQLSHILFDKLNLPKGRKTKTGFSTDSDVLQELAPQHEICNEIISYRELTKLKSTYLDALPLLINKQSGRIHTHFNQALTTTGRLSSHHPNLQNIPIRTTKGAQIRKAFISQPGHKLISADYSQIELRILAHFTHDPGLCRAFIEDLDVHQLTASEIFNVSLTEVTSEMRRRAKAVNFGIAYGQSAFGLSASLGVGQAEASEIIARYFKKFPQVNQYMNETIEQAKKIGYVSTLFGRRRYIDELKSKNGQIRKFGERAAINAPIQGTASDLVKKAMIDLFREVPAQLILQVHDELLFEIRESDVPKVIAQIRKAMEQVYPLAVPLKVNIGVGDNWHEAHH